MKKYIYLKKVKLQSIQRIPLKPGLERLDHREDIAELAESYLKDHVLEKAVIIYLDSAMRPLHIGLVEMSDDNENTIPCNVIIQQALLCNASAVVVVHNHQSDNLQPSKADLITTRTLNFSCQLIGIKMLDHLIVRPEGDFVAIRLKYPGVFNLEDVEI